MDGKRSIYSLQGTRTQLVRPTKAASLYCGFNIYSVCIPRKAKMIRRTLREVSIRFNPVRALDLPSPRSPRTSLLPPSLPRRTSHIHVTTINLSSFHSSSCPCHLSRMPSPAKCHSTITRRDHSTGTWNRVSGPSFCFYRTLAHRTAQDKAHIPGLERERYQIHRRERGRRYLVASS